MAAKPSYRLHSLMALALSSLLATFFTFVPCKIVIAQNTEVVPDEVIVSVHPENDTADLPQQLGKVGAVVGHSSDLHALRIKLPKGISLEAAIAEIQRQPGVLVAEANHIYHNCSSPNDTSYTTQWAPQKVQADLAWSIWAPTASVVIAIVDTGIDNTHPDLTNKIYRDANGIIGYSAFLSKRDNAMDDHGHGTHCAGIAAAQINNSTGIAGIAGWNGQSGSTDTSVKLMPVKVLDSTGSGTDVTVADGVTWAANNGAQVISLSLGSTSSSTVLGNAIAYAWSKGCVVVAAAGNNGSSSLFYPAAYANVISVAATDSTDTLASFSNYGSWVSVAAPGASIYSTLPNNSYATWSGTSMATPHVAGEAALILAMNPSLSNAQVSSYITGNVDLYTPYLGRTIASGAGRINVYKALKAATGISSVPSQVTLQSMTLKSAVAVGGYSTTGTVNLSGPAPTGGAIVMLSSSNTAAIAVPISVTVPAGATSASFTILSNPVDVLTSVTITASYNGTSLSATIKVYAASLLSLTLSSSSVTGGVIVTGTVKLGSPAGPSGCEVTLSSSDSHAVVPASVTIPAGAKSATFSITTSVVAASTSVTIKAVYNGTKSATLTITP